MVRRLKLLFMKLVELEKPRTSLTDQEKGIMFGVLLGTLIGQFIRLMSKITSPVEGVSGGVNQGRQSTRRH